MNDPHDKDYQELRNVDDRLEEMFDEMSPDEIEADARANGEDPEAIEAEVRGLFAAAYKRYSQRPLREAQAAYDQRVESLTRASESDVPESVEEQVALLTAIQAAQPQLLAQFTMRHREFKTMSDADRVSLLRQLKALGVLDALRGEEPGASS